jgi:hypothetical protein
MDHGGTVPEKQTFAPQVRQGGRHAAATGRKRHPLPSRWRMRSLTTVLTEISKE